MIGIKYKKDLTINEEVLMSLSHMELQILELGLLVLAAYFGGRIARKIHIGEVIGQIMGGVLVGPHFLLLVNRGLQSHPKIQGLSIMGPLNLFFENRFNDYSTIMEGAHFFVFLFLGIVAFSLGEELHWNRLKQVGIRATIICVIQAFITWFMLTMGFHYLFKAPWIVAFLIGSIGIATAPALTFILMSKYRIEGHLKNILANIVVLDDVIEVIVFSITLGVAVGMEGGGHLSAAHILSEVFMEFALALLLGLLLFIVLRFTIRNYDRDHEWNNDNDGSDRSLLSTVLSDHPTPSVEILLVILGNIAIVIAIAMHFHLPFLIVAVFAGILVANFHSNALFDSLKLKDVMPLFNLLFFGIIGASVQLETFSLDTLFLVIGYFVLRTVAKLWGNWLGCRITKQDSKITASIPRLMLPQAGMAAVETILVATMLGGEKGEMIFNTIVPALVIFELVGAYLSEKTLVKWKEWTAGEAEAVKSAKAKTELPPPPLELDDLMPLPMQDFSHENLSKTDVIDRLIKSLHKEGYVEDLVYTRNAIIEREKLGTTVLIDGIALPHCRSEAIDTPVVAGCYLEKPLLWQIKPEKEVEMVFMIISPKQKPEEHLQALKTLSHALKSGRFTPITTK
jgi:mannitol/fructose-specific phosphotransferase system IIA component (Ntr-type)/NhaP-type Na+/H+ or K+/H+ antiporter